MESFDSQWDLIAPVFMWTVRTTAKVFNGNYTPYETLFGIKPRLSLDALFSPTDVETISIDNYVSSLITYIKRVHKHVNEWHTKQREIENESQARRLGIGEPFQVGDYVMYRASEEIQNPDDPN